MFLQLLANGLVTGSVYAIAAVGVSLVYGILRLVNFAYGDFMAFGALIAFGVNGPLHSVDDRRDARRDGGDGRARRSLLDVVLWRPLRARRAGFMSLFLASIGLALVLRQALLLAAGPQPRTLPTSTRTGLRARQRAALGGAGHRDRRPPRRDRRRRRSSSR